MGGGGVYSHIITPGGGGPGTRGIFILKIKEEKVYFFFYCDDLQGIPQC